MKLVIINHSDTLGGASVVSYRLMKALRAMGVDASMLVSHKAGNDPHVHMAGMSLRRKYTFLAEHLRIFTANGFNRDDLFKASIATDGLPLSRHPLVKEADGVIINWVNQGMLSLREIGRIAAAVPTVWTMHDMWNLTGVCHHAGECLAYRAPAGCADCPLMHGRAGKHDLSARTFSRKKDLYASVDIQFVAVSTWLRKLAEKSSLMAGCRVSVIPNAFPIEDFYTSPRMASAPFGLPEDKKLIVMGAARLDDPVKGLPYAIEALNRLRRDDAMVVFFGAVRDPHAFDSLHFPYRHIGPVSEAELLRELYARATVVMSTSLYETLPGTLIEGQAAGCTPVSFDRGGQADIIDSSSAGYLVPAYDTEAFASALDSALDNPLDRTSLHNSVEKKFSATAVAEKYKAYFSKL